MAAMKASGSQPDTTAAHNAIDDGNVWRDAAWLVINGADAAAFLQGYLTSDSQRITARTATPMALCTVKGRVLASGWAVAVDNGIALLIHASLIERVAEFLKPFVTFSKCTLECPGGSVVIRTDGDFELLAGIRARICDDGLEGAADASAAMAEVLVEAEFAFVSAPVSEQFLPQMLGLDAAGAVDFDKGCYLGQEIVARAQHRGAVKRRLTTFTFNGQAPETGSKFGDYESVIATAANGQGLAVRRV